MRVCSEDLSPLGFLLPPKEAMVKYLQVNTTDLSRHGLLNSDHTHLLVAHPKHSKARVSVQISMYALGEGLPHWTVLHQSVAAQVGLLTATNRWRW